MTGEKVVLIGAGSAMFTQGLVSDGSVDTPARAQALADDLLAAQAPYLIMFNL